MIFPRRYASCPWPDSRYREYMNGRLKKIDMEARLLRILKGVADKQWYPEWNDKERDAAKRVLHNDKYYDPEFYYNRGFLFHIMVIIHLIYQYFEK